MSAVCVRGERCGGCGAAEASLSLLCGRASLSGDNFRASASVLFAAVESINIGDEHPA
jgi:hypothetical protein